MPLKGRTNNLIKKLLGRIKNQITLKRMLICDFQFQGNPYCASKAYHIAASLAMLETCELHLGDTFEESPNVASRSERRVLNTKS